MDVHNDRLIIMEYTVEYSEEKNLILLETRGVIFQNVIDEIEKNQILDDIKNKNYPNQRMLVVRIKKYVYAVPYVIDQKRKVMFLKTIYPSRVLVKKYDVKGAR